MARNDDPEKYLRTDHLDDNIEGRTVRGGAITSVAQAMKSILEVSSTLILARLLTPEDFGLVAMVTAVTGFLGMFKDMGLGMVTVQREEITHRQVSALFWINAALGVAITIVVIALSWGLVWFYDQPEVFGIAIGLSLAFLVKGLLVQHDAILRRQMRYRSLAVVEVTALAAGLAVAVILAWQGFSYWALVANTVVYAAAHFLGLWIVCGWRPAKPAGAEDLRELIVFGANLTGFSFVNYFARNLDDVLIGRFHGANELGLYQKAYEILMVPIKQINTPASRVAIPALSRMVDEPARYRRAYKRILEKLLLATMPLGALLVGAADWVVLSVLGDQWIDAAPIFAVLGISIFAQAIGNTTGWLFISQDRTDDMFKWGFIGAGTAIVSFFIGLPWGAFGVALAYSIIGICVRTPWLLWYVGRKGPVRTRDFYATAWPAALAALGAGSGLLFLRAYTVFEHPLANLALSVPVAAVSSFVVVLSFPRGREILEDAVELLGHLRASREESEEEGREARLREILESETEGEPGEDDESNQ